MDFYWTVTGTSTTFSNTAAIEVEGYEVALLNLYCTNTDFTSPLAIFTSIIAPSGYGDNKKNILGIIKPNKTVFPHFHQIKIRTADKLDITLKTLDNSDIPDLGVISITLHFRKQNYKVKP